MNDQDTKNISQNRPLTWREAIEPERDLSNRLRRVLLEHGIDPATVDEWIEEHDRSALLLRPPTKQEARIAAMYAMRPPMKDRKQ